MLDALLRAYPGYTLSSLLNEEADTLLRLRRLLALKQPPDDDGDL